MSHCIYFLKNQVFCTILEIFVSYQNFEWKTIQTQSMCCVEDTDRETESEIFFKMALIRKRQKSQTSQYNQCVTGDMICVKKLIAIFLLFTSLTQNKKF